MLVDYVKFDNTSMLRSKNTQVHLSHAPQQVNELSVLYWVKLLFENKVIKEKVYIKNKFVSVFKKIKKKQRLFLAFDFVLWDKFYYEIL